MTYFVTFSRRPWSARFRNQHKESNMAKVYHDKDIKMQPIL